MLFLDVPTRSASLIERYLLRVTILIPEKRKSFFWFIFNSYFFLAYFLQYDHEVGTFVRSSSCLTGGDETNIFRKTTETLRLVTTCPDCLYDDDEDDDDCTLAWCASLQGRRIIYYLIASILDFRKF